MTWECSHVSRSVLERNTAFRNFGFPLITKPGDAAKKMNGRDSVPSVRFFLKNTEMAKAFVVKY